MVNASVMLPRQATTFIHHDRDAAGSGGEGTKHSLPLQLIDSVAVDDAESDDDVVSLVENVAVVVADTVTLADTQSSSVQFVHVVAPGWEN